MATLIPTASSCHNLQLPPTEKDDRLNLNVRTGSASTLYNSLVITYGGLTIGLELGDNLKISDLIDIFFLKLINLKSKRLDKYLSGELFYLNLIERHWRRVEVGPNDPKPKPRLFHEVCGINNYIYVFGGLIIPDESKLYEDVANDTSQGNKLDYSKYLVPANDLWEFDLATSKWSLLHDGSGFENDPSIPKPRYSHKMSVINSLKFVNKNDHFGLFLAGGRDINSNAIYDNSLFDLVDKKYVKKGSAIHLVASSGNQKKDEASGLAGVSNTNDNYNLGVDYCNSIIINFVDEIDKGINNHSENSILKSGTNVADNSKRNKKLDLGSKTSTEESIIVYTPTKKQSQEEAKNPLISFKIGKTIKHAKVLPIHKKKVILKSNSKTLNHTIPFNLRYPTGGLFGQNIVITGFLPNDLDISIFIYNKPTGKWSRLNIFCNHDYGSHRFWGGFAWQSHHKVVLIGNYVTSRTTSSIRYFTSMITVSLPITNILASSELATGKYRDIDGERLSRRDDGSFANDEFYSDDDLTGESLLAERTTDDDNLTSSSPDVMSEEDDESGSTELVSKKSPRRISTLSLPSKSTNSSTDKFNNTISFSEYVDYAAPRTNFTKIRSVFPPAAITLGRNAFDRFGDLISDFEFVSSDGDRIPVSLTILMERWGKFFINLLARGYVRAVDKFEADQSLAADDANLKFSKSSGGSGSTNISAINPNYNFKFQNLNYHNVLAPNKLKNSVSTGNSSISSSSDLASHDGSSTNLSSGKSPLNDKRTYHISIPVPPKAHQKEAPQFRLPFQETSSLNETKTAIPSSHEETPPPNSSGSNSLIDSTAIDPHSINATTNESSADNAPTSRKNSITSFSSNNSLLSSHLQDLPPQLPLPSEPIPAVPATSVSFKSTSRKNSLDLGSPRASLIHTLTTLRNIPTSRSPKDSPFASPRTSMSGQGHGPSKATFVNSSESSSSPKSSIANQGVNQNTDGDLSTIQATNPRPNFSHTPKSLGTSPNTSNDAFSPIPTIGDNTLDSTAGSNYKKGLNPISPSNKKIPSFSSMTSVESSTFAMERDKNFSSLSSNISSNNDFGDNNTTGESQHQEDIRQGDNEPGRIFNNALLNFDNLENGKLQMEPSLIPRKLYMPFSTSTLKAFAEYLYTGQVGNKWSLTPATLDNLSIAKFFRVPLLYDLISEVLFGIIGRKEAYVIQSGNRLKRKYFKLLRATNTPIDPNFQFPLDEYEGFMDTVDDGYLDLALLKKSSKIHKNSTESVMNVGNSTRKKKSVTSNISGASAESGSRRTSANDIDLTENDEMEDEFYNEEQAKQEVTEKIGDSPSNQPEQITKTAADSLSPPKQSSSDESSDKKTTSNSEEDNDFELGYLDVHDRSVPGLGPRSKSIFDRNRVENQFNSIFDADDEDNDQYEKDEDDPQTQKEKILLLNLESLVSPTSPPPSDFTIDLIYETAALTTDLKLMLRAANARQMSRILSQTKIEFEKIIDHLKNKFDEQQNHARVKQEIIENEIEEEEKEIEKEKVLKPNLPESNVNASPGIQSNESVYSHGKSQSESSSIPYLPLSSSGISGPRMSATSPNHTVFGGNDGYGYTSSPGNIVKSVSDPSDDIEADELDDLEEDEEINDDLRSNDVTGLDSRLSSNESIGDDFDQVSAQNSALDTGSIKTNPNSERYVSPVPSYDNSDLKPNSSSISLTPMNNNKLIEKAKTNSFRGIAGFTPFKYSKNDSKLSAREIDKRINKILKKEEKTKIKEENKIKEIEKKQQAKNFRHISGTGLPAGSIQPTSSRPILSRSSSRIFGDNSTNNSVDDRNYTTGNSPAPSISSGSERNSTIINNPNPAQYTSASNSTTSLQQPQHHHNFLRHLGGSHKKKYKEQQQLQQLQQLQQQQQQQQLQQQQLQQHHQQQQQLQYQQQLQQNQQQSQTQHHPRTQTILSQDQSYVPMQQLQKQNTSTGEESLLDSSNLSRTKSALSMNSLNSNNTVNTNKKLHGMFSIKKSPPN